ncbi:MAG TPA: histidine phosphatase family protein [Acidimicrobiales bacterium]|nr:histidine phosphatase family protein [Acidimicrobiales bacterium]
MATPTPRRFSQQPFRRPDDATEIVLVRHGASADFVEGEEFELVEGQGDPPLSDIGRRQAELVGRRLAHTEVAAIYVSSLRRTAETAAPLAALTGLTPMVEPDLREIFLGEWEGGVFRSKVADQDPLAMRIFTEERWDVVPGAEPAEKFARRLRDAIERIAAAHPGASVVAFSHGAAIGEILAQASGSRPLAFLNSDNTAISRIIVTPDRWLVRTFGDISHLDDASGPGQRAP